MEKLARWVAEFDITQPQKTPIELMYLYMLGWNDGIARMQAQVAQAEWDADRYYRACWGKDLNSRHMKAAIRDAGMQEIEAWERDLERRNKALEDKFAA